MTIPVVYIDTANPDYRDWQLLPDQPYLICIDCGKLVRRHSPLQHRCKKCWGKKGTPNVAAAKQRMKKRRKKREGKGWAGVSKRWIKAHPSCVMCGATKCLTVDHIIPLKLGGTSDPSNLQTLCAKCHKMKTLEDEINYNPQCLHTIVQWDKYAGVGKR